MVSMRTGKENKDESHPPYFPEEIMHQIFARLPQECLIELRYVCKQWHRLISLSKFAADSFRHSQPALLIQAPTSNKTKKFKTKLLELDKEGLGFKYKNFGMSRMGKARSTCNGLLLVDGVNKKKNLLVMNVLTKCYVTIPECPSSCQHLSCGLAIVFNSHEKVYKVVHVCGDGFVFEIFTLGCSENEWKVIPGPFSRLNEQPPFNPALFRWSDPLSTNGQLILHWNVDSSQYIISFDTCEERFRKTYLPCYFEKEKGTLLVMGDKLSFINKTSSTQFDVWVLEDYKRQLWNKRSSVLVESISYPSQDINALPSFENLKPICSLRDGEVLVFHHRNSTCWYLYETKLSMLKKLSGILGKNPNLLLYKSSLVRWKNEEELAAREGI